MPNNHVFRRPFTKRGQNWLPPTKPPTPPLADVTGSGGVLVGGAATVLESVLVATVTGAGGAALGGAATIGYGDHVGAITGSGGVRAGDSAEVQFVHGAQVASDVVVEWDLDNDGDFSETVEDITSRVMSAETFTGRDWPSLLTGRAGAGKLRASLRNDDDLFNYFNASSPLVTSPYSLKTGRKVRVRASSATTPDPALLVRDRFRRADGALEGSETGQLYTEPLATNKVQNPSFETNTTGWTAQGGSAIARVTSIAQSGSASLEIKRSATNPPFYLYGPKCTGVDTGATTGDTAVISAWVYIPAASYPKLSLIVFGAAGVDYTFADTSDLVPDTWTQVSRVVTLTATLDDIDIQFWTDDTHANGDVVAYVDNVTATVTSWAVTSNKAVATEEGGVHLAVIDTGAADYYVQARINVTGAISNRVGIVYRYVDSNDYSLCVVDLAAGGVYLLDVTAGVESVAAARTTDVYGGITLGVLVEGSTATLYQDGVPVLTAAAPNTSAELVGIFASWATGDTRPEVDDLYVWDGLPSAIEGVLWTGDIAELVSSVQAGPEKVATISGEGWLSKLATQRVTPPVSIDGRKTGLLMGNVLASAGLLHPPGSIAEGDVTTGTVAISETTAMDAARSFEETEYGFLYETQEGPLSFQARSERDGSTSLATFTDATDGKYGYHRLEPYDWRREVFNRIIAGISPWTEGSPSTLYTDPGPYILTAGETATVRASSTGLVSRWTGHTRDVKIPAAPSGITVTTQASTIEGSIAVALPATVNDGDLLLILVGNALQGANWDGFAPTGWTIIRKTTTFGVVAKVGESGDSGGTATFNSVNSDWVAHTYRVTSWYGSLDGVEVSDFVSNSSQPNPPPITPTWGAVSTLFIAAWKTWNGWTTQTGVPSGYANGVTNINTDGNGVAMGSARRIAAVATEDPGPFTTSPAVGPLPVTIAIRGGVTTTQVTGSVPAGDDGTFTISYDAAVGGGTQSHENIQVTGVPLVQGDQQLVQADGYSSQDDHNAIRTYTNPANLFSTAMDAQTYADLVLATHADDRPIVSMSFYPSKSKAYRAQALRRRIGDRITLVADHNTGFGISRDFYIESISHKWSHGVRLWETTWELSPV